MVGIFLEPMITSGLPKSIIPVLLITKQYFLFPDETCSTCGSIDSVVLLCSKHGTRETRKTATHVQFKILQLFIE